MNPLEITININSVQIVPSNRKLPVPIRATVYCKRVFPDSWSDNMLDRQQFLANFSLIRKSAEADAKSIPIPFSADHLSDLNHYNKQAKSSRYIWGRRIFTIIFIAAVIDVSAGGIYKDPRTRIIQGIQIMALGLLASLMQDLANVCSGKHLKNIEINDGHKRRLRNEIRAKYVETGRALKEEYRAAKKGLESNQKMRSSVARQNHQRILSICQGILLGQEGLERPHNMDEAFNPRLVMKDIRKRMLELQLQDTQIERDYKKALVPISRKSNSKKLIKIQERTQRRIITEVEQMRRKQIEEVIEPLKEIALDILHTEFCAHLPLQAMHIRGKSRRIWPTENPLLNTADSPVLINRGSESKSDSDKKIDIHLDSGVDE